MYVDLGTNSKDTIHVAQKELQIYHSVMKVNSYLGTIVAALIKFKEYNIKTKDTSFAKNWNFIKMHLRLHALDNIEDKGPSRGMSTKPYEKMHGPLKKIYQRQTNFKDIAPQV